MNPAAQTHSPTQSAADLATATETNSLVYRRLDTTLRREINIAIIDRRAESLRAVHRRFNLDASGVNYHAFYRYARRIRAEAALIEMTAATPAQDGDAQRLLPRVLAQRLLECLAFENPAPRRIQRLAEAYRASVAALINLRRAGLLPSKPKDGKQKPLTPADANDELASIVREYGQLVARDGIVQAGKRVGLSDEPVDHPRPSPLQSKPSGRRGARHRKTRDKTRCETHGDSPRTMKSPRRSSVAKDDARRGVWQEGIPAGEGARMESRTSDGGSGCEKGISYQRGGSGCEKGISHQRHVALGDRHCSQSSGTRRSGARWVDESGAMF
ncbi:MAG: hypothetical protein H6819_03465 [Phycisphaerales bacterium]|nr:hypothetical protein [Phycisphaerales bacterium]MCB9856255.1 hypothetical protein [Phycisphaerales bacterium]MCB9863306.1 hypothetical protein [Phycisphaerales bacterium]